MDNLNCRGCGSNKVAGFEIDGVEIHNGKVLVGWICKRCQVPHWADFELNESSLKYDDTAYEPPETGHNHPSLTRAERNPGLTR